MTFGRVYLEMIKQCLEELNVLNLKKGDKLDNEKSLYANCIISLHTHTEWL